VIFVSRDRYDEDTLLAAALESGAEDVVADTSSYQITIPPEKFEAAKRRLQEEGVEYESAELTQLPQTTIQLEARDAERVLHLCEALEELEDVQAVYANFDIPEALMERLSSRSASGR
jgi:transcriptional/translational regulatory protein YebC/TACO1